jgi:hypothetical protein
MPTKKKSPASAARKKSSKQLITGVRKMQLRAVSTRHVVVKQLAAPPTFVKPKKIHPRHLLPLVREGMERGFHSQTAEAFLRPLGMIRSPQLMAAGAPFAAANEITLVTNTELTRAAQQQTASNVGEPSVAVNGNVVFYTGNWYAAVSNDAGRTFQFIDPGGSFKNPKPNSEFCCDQVVHYISKIDTFVWLLQYGPDTGDNIQRLAFAKTADVVANKWRLFDITTQSLGVTGAFLDFPDLALSANNLYVTTNIFGPGNNDFGSAMIRIPFASIASGKPTAQSFVSMDLQSFRVAQNCDTTAFFAAHQDTSTLAVFSWKEGQATPVRKSVGVARWLGGNGYISTTPDGRRWLDRADPRLTGATLAKNELWFAWTVDRNSNHRPNPFVQIARIDATNLTLLDNVNIFDSNSATAYGALSTNENGEVGISYMIGGGPLAPSHVVGILTGVRKDMVVSNGDRGPLDPKNGRGEWGDYLTVRRAFPNQKLFAATGFTMKGPGDKSNRDATPRFVVFGRAADVGGPFAGVDGGATGVVVTPGIGGAPVVVPPVVIPPVVVPPVVIPGTETAGTPFKNVNTLPVVSSSVAAQIKAAARAEGEQESPHESLFVPLMMVTKPGVERWPVKTGNDVDVANVGKNIIAGVDLGVGIVQATVEELIVMGRPLGMRPASKNFDSSFHQTRLGVFERTVWQIVADVIALKLEKDGDYHLVLQGASGETMVAEIPTPTKTFVTGSPWLANLKDARKKIDDKLVNKLTPASFVQFEGMLVPRESLPEPVQMFAMAAPSHILSFSTQADGDTLEVATFKTKVKPTAARITGVGFFDKVHGQMGVAQFNGAELHPILKIEFL